MKNFENEELLKKIGEVTIDGSKYAIDKDTHEIGTCSDVGCKYCMFFDGMESCNDEKYYWANDDFVEGEIK